MVPVTLGPFCWRFHSTLPVPAEVAVPVGAAWYAQVPRQVPATFAPGFGGIPDVHVAAPSPTSPSATHDRIRIGALPGDLRAIPDLGRRGHPITMIHQGRRRH